MSQEKVDRYKAEKANRKQIMRKEKIARRVRQCVTAMVAVVLIGWAGYSVYRAYEDNQPTETAEIDYSAMDSLWTNLESTAE